MYYICIIEGVGGNKQFLVKVKFKQLLRNFEAEPQENFCSVLLYCA